MARGSYRKRNNDAFLLAVISSCAILAIYLRDKITGSAIGWLAIGLISAAAIVGVVMLISRKFSDLWQTQRMRALSSSEIDTMDGRTFEKYVAELLRSQGYKNVKIVDLRNDIGVDIVAEKSGVRWGIQAKRYSKPVGKRAVSDVVAGLLRHNCKRAMVITNSTFTNKARGLAADHGCALVGRDELAGWILEFQAN